MSWHKRIMQCIGTDFCQPSGWALATCHADVLTLCAQDSKHARELARVMCEAGQVVPPELEQMQAYGGGGGGGGRYRAGT